MDMLYTILQKELEKRQIEIFGTGNQTRDFIYINDVINTVEKLINIKSLEQAIDLGTGESIKIVKLGKL